MRAFGVEEGVAVCELEGLLSRSKTEIRGAVVRVQNEVDLVLASLVVDRAVAEARLVNNQ